MLETCELDPTVVKHYVIVRKDLPPGIQAAMIVHAAGESGAIRGVPPHTHAVVLTVADEAALVELSRQMEGPWSLILESDEPYSGQLMAIGIAPSTAAELAPQALRALKQLPLLK